MRTVAQDQFTSIDALTLVVTRKRPLQKTLVSFTDLPKMQTLTPLKSHKREVLTLIHMAVRPPPPPASFGDTRTTGQGAILPTCCAVPPSAMSMRPRLL